MARNELLHALAAVDRRSRDLSTATDKPVTLRALYGAWREKRDVTSGWSLNHTVSDDKKPGQRRTYA